MSSTNKTANYELSQYIGSDKPTYLVDYNGDMLKIDTGMAANKAQADATDLIVSGHTSSIAGLQGTVSDQGTAITGLRTDVDGNTGSINTINSLIGNGEPTTTDKTLIGAINELDGDITSINGRVSAFKLADYELSQEVTADGVETLSALILRCLNTLRNALKDNERVQILELGSSYSYFGKMPFSDFILIGKTGIFSISGSDFVADIANSKLVFHDYYLNDDIVSITQSECTNGTWSYTDSATLLANVPTNGTTLRLIYNKYEVV